MDHKIKSTIKSIFMALLSIAGFIGLGQYIPLLETLLANVDGVVEAGIRIVEFVVLVMAWKPATDSNVAGNILKSKMSSRPRNLSNDKRKDLFDYAEAA